MICPAAHPAVGELCTMTSLTSGDVDLHHPDGSHRILSTGAPMGARMAEHLATHAEQTTDPTQRMVEQHVGPGVSDELKVGTLVVGQGFDPRHGVVIEAPPGADPAAPGRVWVWWATTESDDFDYLAHLELVADLTPVDEYPEPEPPQVTSVVTLVVRGAGYPSVGVIDSLAVPLMLAGLSVVARSISEPIDSWLG